MITKKVNVILDDVDMEDINYDEMSYNDMYDNLEEEDSQSNQYGVIDNNIKGFNILAQSLNTNTKDSKKKKRRPQTAKTNFISVLEGLYTLNCKYLYSFQFLGKPRSLFEISV